MPKLKPLRWRELISGLRQFGFEGPFSGGRHPFMIRGDVVLTIPNPHNEDISANLITRILKQAGITREEWIDETQN